MNRLKGMHAALLTGLSDDGEFSPERQRSINAYVLRQGLDGLYVGGSSGESGLLTAGELLDQQAIVAEDARSQDCQLIAHVGAPNLRDSIQLARSAAKLGYNALSALPPHAYPFSDQEIIAYYKELSAATDLPMIVYEVPIRTGRPLSNDVLAQLLDIKNVAGIKFTSNDMFKMARLRKAHPQKLVFFGFDEVYLAAAALGVDGGIGTTYNILGKLYAALHSAIANHDLVQARELQELSQEFVATILLTGVLPGVKIALQEIGVDCGPTRAPFMVQSAKGESAVRSLIQSPEYQHWLAK
ncbi:dihydrodipicolinate synthase family protein [uncultured Maritalea sp.]|jgi:N-acetylneuraminate lyase|uniref:dihydrodipicolinate synthase family protein n=1 Tax=uncultured Maritalea sp. TaxID=757249 RepID=UPI002626ED24|nr:dihydrodipicolinate synthase family protein [uncultured Maritalea sp.]